MGAGPERSCAAFNVSATACLQSSPTGQLHSPDQALTWPLGASCISTDSLYGSGWVPSTGSDLFGCIDESTASDVDYITSPDLSTSATMGLTASVPAGNWAVNVRGRRMGVTGSIRVVLLSSGGAPVGTSSWQPLTAGFADYSFNVTTSGAADRFRIEVQA